MAVVRTGFPPHEFTEDEEAAMVGRYVESHERRPDPAGSGKAGREQAAPRGVVYVRAEVFEGPEGEVEVVEEIEAEAEEESEEEAEAESEEDDELKGFTVAELKAELDALGVEYDPKARKAELRELVRQAETAE